MSASATISGNTSVYNQIDPTVTVEYQLYIALPINSDGFMMFNGTTNVGDCAVLDTATMVWNKSTNVLGVDTTKFASAAQGILAGTALQSQMKADWNAPSGPAQILNKPTIPAAQVNSDWSSSTGLSQILNKPSIPAAQVNSDWSASSGVSLILNKPSIPAAQVNSDWNATSGLAQILNKPTIPSVVTPTINNGVSRSIVTSTSATGFQISSTRQSRASYTIDTSTTATIGGASTATVYLETAATNSTTPSDWTIIDKISNGQTITLAIALQSVQTATLKLDANIAVGAYVRIRSANTGTSSTTYYLGQETIN